MNPVENDCSWQDFLRDCNLIDDSTPSNLLWPNSSGSVDGFASLDIDFSATTPPVAPEEGESNRKRVRVDSCSNRTENKACREKQRREKLNDRMNAFLYGRDPSYLWMHAGLWICVLFWNLGGLPELIKPAILDDAIRVMNQLKHDSQELKYTNERLMEEIKSLKAEKNELREEKLVLKADKERVEQQLKSVAVTPPGFMSPHQAAYHAAANKMAAFPSYGMLPMFHYFPPSLNDSSRDHEHRPHAA